MTVATYDLGRPLPAPDRGGDCRARDLSQGRNVKGMHRFVASDHCRINNGLLRVTVGASGVAPALTLEAHRGPVAIDDVYEDLYEDLYGGSMTLPTWFSVGTITVDSPSVAAVLTGVRLAQVSDEEVTIRLVAPLMTDAFITLRRGRRNVDIFHGDTRASSPANIDRRVRLTASPSPVGTASTGRVEEDAPVIDGFPRFVTALDPVTENAGAFSLTATADYSARFGAGVGTYAYRDRPADIHREMGDASLPLLVVS